MIRRLPDRTIIAYLDSEWKPVEPNQATIIKVIYPDGRTVFARPSAQMVEVDSDIDMKRSVTLLTRDDKKDDMRWVTINGRHFKLWDDQGNPQAIDKAKERGDKPDYQGNEPLVQAKWLLDPKGMVFFHTRMHHTIVARALGNDDPLQDSGGTIANNHVYQDMGERSDETKRRVASEWTKFRSMESREAEVEDQPVHFVTWMGHVIPIKGAKPQPGRPIPGAEEKELPEAFGPHRTKEGVVKLPTGDTWRYSYRREFSDAPPSATVTPDQVDGVHEAAAVQAAFEAARMFWTSDDPDARALRAADNEPREAADLSKMKADMHVIFTMNMKDYGMGSAGYGGGKVFWGPYSVPDREARLTAPNGYHAGQSIGVDPMYVMGHELHHAFGYGSEFDKSSDVVGVAAHIISGLQHNPAAATEQVHMWLANYSYGSKPQWRNNSGRSLRWLNNRWPDAMEHLAVMSGYTQQQWHETVDKFNRIGRHKAKESMRLKADQIDLDGHKPEEVLMVSVDRLHPRMGGTGHGPERPEEVAQAMKSGKMKMKPLTAIKREDGEWWIGDGHRRFGAAEILGIPRLPVVEIREVATKEASSTIQAVLSLPSRYDDPGHWRMVMGHPVYIKDKVPGAVTKFDTPEVVAARKGQSEIQHTSDIKTPERARMRATWVSAETARLVADNPEKGRQFWLVLGLPASGKSGQVAEPLAQRVKGALVDSDELKKYIPEFNRGGYGGSVHRESSDMSSMVMQNLMREGYNVVRPTVGDQYERTEGMLALAKAYGYTAHVAYVDIPEEEAAKRAVERFAREGRFVDPTYVLDVDGKPKEVYNRIKMDPRWDSHEAWDNNVPRGQKARRITAGELGEAQRVHPGVGLRIRNAEYPEGSEGVSKGKGTSFTREAEKVKDKGYPLPKETGVVEAAEEPEILRWITKGGVRFPIIQRGAVVKGAPVGAADTRTQQNDGFEDFKKFAGERNSQIISRWWYNWQDSKIAMAQAQLAQWANGSTVHAEVAREDMDTSGKSLKPVADSIMQPFAKGHDELTADQIRDHILHDKSGWAEVQSYAERYGLEMKDLDWEPVQQQGTRRVPVPDQEHPEDASKVTWKTEPVYGGVRFTIPGDKGPASSEEMREAFDKLYTWTQSKLQDAPEDMTLYRGVHGAQYVKMVEAADNADKEYVSLPLAPPDSIWGMAGGSGSAASFSSSKARAEGFDGYRGASQAGTQVYKNRPGILVKISVPREAIMVAAPRANPHLYGAHGGHEQEYVVLSDQVVRVRTKDVDISGAAV